MIEEKFFPISINTELCVRCQRCMYSCSPKAIFFKNSMRYVDYDKCKGCLKCVDVCEHGAIEVISIKEGKLKGFYIDPDKCSICKHCLKDAKENQILSCEDFIHWLERIVKNYSNFT